MLSRRAAAQAQIEPPIGELIEHADFLEQAHRFVRWYDVAQRPEPQPSGALSDRRKKEVR